MVFDKLDKTSGKRGIMSIKLTPKVIKEAQALLIVTGYDKGKLVANGRFDEPTREALLCFQGNEVIKVTGELDEATLHFMINKEFDMAYGDTDPVKLIQAAMILLGFDTRDELVANGRPDDLTRELLQFFIAYSQVGEWHSSISAGEEHAETTAVPDNDLPPNGEGEINRV